MTMKDGPRSAKERPWTNDPLTILILGAGSDHTRQDTIPSLRDLYFRDLIPSSFVVFGFDTTPLTNEEFRASLHQPKQSSSAAESSNNRQDFYSKNVRSGDEDEFLKHCFYRTGTDYSDFNALSHIFGTSEKSSVWHNLVIIMACSASFVSQANTALHMALKRHGKLPGWVRVYLTGQSFASAQAYQTVSAGLFRRLTPQQLYQDGTPHAATVLALHRYNPFLQTKFDAIHVRQYKAGPCSDLLLAMQFTLLPILAALLMELPSVWNDENSQTCRLGFFKSMVVKDTLVVKPESAGSNASLACMHCSTPSLTSIVLEACSEQKEDLLEIRLFQGEKLFLSIILEPWLRLTMNVYTSGQKSTQLVSYGWTNEENAGSNALSSSGQALLNVLKGDQDFCHNDEETRLLLSLVQRLHETEPLLPPADRDGFLARAGIPLETLP